MDVRLMDVSAGSTFLGTGCEAVADEDDFLMIQ